MALVAPCPVSAPPSQDPQRGDNNQAKHGKDKGDAEQQFGPQHPGGILPGRGEARSVGQRRSQPALILDHELHRQAQSDFRQFALMMNRDRREGRSENQQEAGQKHAGPARQRAPKAALTGHLQPWEKSCSPVIWHLYASRPSCTPCRVSCLLTVGLNPNLLGQAPADEQARGQRQGERITLPGKLPEYCSGCLHPAEEDHKEHARHEAGHDHHRQACACPDARGYRPAGLLAEGHRHHIGRRAHDGGIAP